MTNPRNITSDVSIDISLEIDRLSGLVSALQMVCRAEEELENERRHSVEALQGAIEDQVNKIRDAWLTYEAAREQARRSQLRALG